MNIKKLVAVVAAVILVLALLGASVTIVPTGFTGVRMTYGQISDKVVPQGVNFKIPFVQSIKLVNNKIRDVVISGQVWGETSERTPVYASDIYVTYQVSSGKSAWLFANVNNTDDLISSSLVSSAIKSAMVELRANEVTIRSKIEPLAKEKLIESISEKYGEGTLEILKVVINNMDFEESYNEAIAQKSIAQQTQERQRIENETAIAKAEADKQVEITKAEATAEAKKIEAQAEAEANRILAASLSDEVLKHQFYNTWDGQLPQVMGEGTVITSIAD